MNKVTGLSVTPDSDANAQQRASSAFVKAWNYDFFWNIWVHSPVAFNGFYTRMGHAEYAAGGVDFSNEVFCPFEDVEDALNFRATEKYPFDFQKALQGMNADYKNMQSFYPECVNMSGSYISALSGLIEIFGWEMLLFAVGDDEERFGEVIEDYGKFIMQYIEALGKCDSPVVMIHDDLCWTSGLIFRKEFYHKYLFPLLKKEVHHLRDCGKKVIFTSDGNFTDLIDDIAACGVEGFVLEPSTDMKYIAEKYGKTHVIIGNADTRILLNGSKEDIYAEVKRCVDIGKNCPGYFMAVGNHIPSNTPIENALYYYNDAYEKLSKR